MEIALFIVGIVLVSFAAGFYLGVKRSDIVKKKAAQVKEVL